MKKGNFDEALLQLLQMLKDSADKGNRDCGMALCEWDSIRGTDWYTKEEQRYVFVHGDGDFYMIPVELQETYIKMYDNYEDVSEKFKEYRVDSISEYTFTNPK